MNYPSDLLQNIKATKPKRETLLIGIDGFGGAGKTTLSSYLHDNLPNVTIVQLDDFYLPTLGRADRSRVIDQIFIPLEKDMTTMYEIYDWVTDSLHRSISINPGGIVIIEGVYALHQDFVSYYDYKIWINCSPELGFKRGVDRDKMRDGIDNSDKWKNIWMPNEKEYVDTENPKQYADYILEVE
ncbi:MAG: uridine kinase [Candidatus Roizmanbacteria bacterium]|nr:uridine kinase [Candidatus Roizmanbacteria bacterium]